MSTGSTLLPDVLGFTSYYLNSCKREPIRLIKYIDKRIRMGAPWLDDIKVNDMILFGRTFID